MFKFHKVMYLLCFVTFPPSVYAEQSATDTDKALSTTITETLSGKDEEENTLEIERIAKLEAGLKADKIELEDLKKSLDGRSKILKLLQTALNSYKAKLEKVKEELALAEEKGFKKEAARLEKEIRIKASDYDLIAGQAQLAFEAEKTVRHQIELIENSLIKKQQTLDEFKGVKKRVIIVPDQALPVVAIPAIPSSDAAPITPMQIMMPGLPTPTVDSRTTTVAPIEQILTAEQVEARKQAKLRTREALEAEKVAVDYIKQNSALIERVKSAKKLLETDIKSRSNYRRFLEILESRLLEAKNTGADEAGLKKVMDSITLIEAELSTLNKEISKRKEIIEVAQEEMISLEKDQELLAEEALKKREQAEDAQEEVIWLQSPLHPQNLLTWAYTRGPRVLMVLILMAVLLFINRVTAKRVSRVMARKNVRTGEVSQNRVNTLALSLRGAVRVVIVFGGTILALQEAGVDVKTVLGGAAILGVAVAFGAQNLMRDYFNGLMILLEDQYELSDTVTINNITGTVERVSMRSTMLRDIRGQAHFIPNGSITLVTNATFEWARAVMEIPVAYKENVDHVMSVIIELANGMRKDSQFSADILDEPVMLGVNSFEDSAVNIKFMLQTKADRMWPVQREMLRRIKNRFDELGIEFAHPQRVISQSTPAKVI